MRVWFWLFWWEWDGGVAVLSWHLSGRGTGMPSVIFRQSARQNYPTSSASSVLLRTILEADGVSCTRRCWMMTWIRERSTK